jgi:predicted CXXCH cytochrome family protein
MNRYHVICNAIASVVKQGTPYFFCFCITVAVLLSATVIMADENEECIKCHGKVFNAALNKMYIHTPFLEKKCVTCHIDNNRATGRTSNAGDRSRKNSRKQEKKIKWLKKHYQPALKHWFLLADTRIDDTLFVQLQGADNKPEVRTLKLPSLEELPKLKNDFHPPEISNIRFLGVKRGVLYSATVAWETDKASESHILFGTNALDRKSVLDSMLTRNHLVTISPLKSGKRYQYAMVSEDIFGNKKVSKPYEFQTSKLKPLRDTTWGEIDNHGRPLKLKLAMFGAGEKYLITLTTDRPTYMAVGSNFNLRRRIGQKATGLSGKTRKFDHPALTSVYELSITICLNCHQDYETSSSHPVNVPPKRGMNFPDNYPVLSNGRMTCVSCHAAHGANHEHRMRRSSKRELCIGCHKNYG